MTPAEMVREHGALEGKQCVLFSLEEPERGTQGCLQGESLCMSSPACNTGQGSLAACQGWLGLWQLVKAILERTTGEDSVSLGVWGRKRSWEQTQPLMGSCRGLITTAEVPWTGWTCRYVGSYLTLPLISYFLFWSQSFNASLSTAPSLAFGFRPGINEYPKPDVIWLLQIY